MGVSFDLMLSTDGSKVTGDLQADGQIWIVIVVGFSSGGVSSGVVVQ